jgi:hypothetical protein
MYEANMHTYTNTKEQQMGRSFDDIKIGGLFHLNGNDYVKQSTRTARMLSNGRVFYIGKQEYCHPIAY